MTLELFLSHLVCTIIGAYAGWELKSALKNKNRKGDKKNGRT